MNLFHHHIHHSSVPTPKTRLRLDLEVLESQLLALQKREDTEMLATEEELESEIVAAKEFTISNSENESGYI
jgi:hypothetical protein